MPLLSVPYLSRTIVLVILPLLLIAMGCSTYDSLPQNPVPFSPDPPVADSGHIGGIVTIDVNLQNNIIDITPERFPLGHIGYGFELTSGFPEFLLVELIDLDKWNEKITFDIQFTNTLPIPVYDPRIIIQTCKGITPIEPDAYTDYHPGGVDSINPFYAFAKDFPRRAIPSGESDARELVIEYDSLTSVIKLKVIIDACIGGNAPEPYDIINITQRGRSIYADILDRRDDAENIRVSRPDDPSWDVLLNRINEEKTFSAALYFPDNPPEILLISASGSGSPYSIYKYTGWDNEPLPMKYGRGIYAWTFYNPDTGNVPQSYIVIISQCRNKFGCDWLIANMGYACYDGSIFHDEQFFRLLRDLKTVAPDFPVFLNLGLLGFGPGEYDHCGGLFDGDWRRFFGAVEKSLWELNKKFEFQDYVEGICLDFETLLAPQPMWYRREFMDAYGDFEARLRYYPEFEGLYLVPYNDALMPKELGYDYDALNHLKQGDFFLTAAFPTSYAWNQDWWLELTQNTQYMHVPSAEDYLKTTLGIYHDLAETVSTPFQPIVGTNAVWMDYHGDTLPHVQPCSWKYLANIDAWCFGHPSSFGSSDEQDITRGRWLHKKEVERVIADLPSVDVDVLSKMGAVFYQLGDRDPDTVGDDVIWHRAPYSYQMFDEVIGGYDSPYCFDPVIFHWEIAHDYKMYAFLQKSPGGLGAVSGRISFEDGSKFVDHLDEFHDARVEVTGLPEGLPEYFYSTDIIGVDDGSYAFAGIPAGKTITLRAYAGSYISDPVVVEVKKKMHSRGVDLILH